jgi:hypothetical protein
MQSESESNDWNAFRLICSNQTPESAEQNSQKISRRLLPFATPI